MTEVSFARTYLALLDTKPTKLSPEHIEDPKTWAPHSAYILPAAHRALMKETTLTPKFRSPQTLTIHLTCRNPSLSLILPQQTATTSVLDLKIALSSKGDLNRDNVRILYKKRPLGDSKILKDFLTGDEVAGGGTVELGVMVLGGRGGGGDGSFRSIGSAEGAAEEESKRPAQDMLGGKTFWSDLRGFLMQRLRNEEVGGEVFEIFKKAWEGKHKP